MSVIELSSFVASKGLIENEGLISELWKDRKVPAGQLNSWYGLDSVEHKTAYMVVEWESEEAFRAFSATLDPEAKAKFLAIISVPGAEPSLRLLAVQKGEAHKAVSGGMKSRVVLAPRIPNEEYKMRIHGGRDTLSAQNEEYLAILVGEKGPANVESWLVECGFVFTSVNVGFRSTYGADC